MTKNSPNYLSMSCADNKTTSSELRTTYLHVPPPPAGCALQTLWQLADAPAQNMLLTDMRHCKLCRSRTELLQRVRNSKHVHSHPWIACSTGKGSTYSSTAQRQCLQARAAQGLSRSSSLWTCDRTLQGIPHCRLLPHPGARRRTGRCV